MFQIHNSKHLNTSSSITPYMFSTKQVCIISAVSLCIHTFLLAVLNNQVSWGLKLISLLLAFFEGLIFPYIIIIIYNYIKGDKNESG